MPENVCSLARYTGTSSTYDVYLDAREGQTRCDEFLGSGNAWVAETVKLFEEVLVAGALKRWDEGRAFAPILQTEYPLTPMPWLSAEVSGDQNPEPGPFIKDANSSMVQWSK